MLSTAKKSLMNSVKVWLQSALHCVLCSFFRLTTLLKTKPKAVATWVS